MRQSSHVRDYATIQRRVVVFAIYVLVLLLMDAKLRDGWNPVRDGLDLWLVSAIGMLAYRAFSTPFFVPVGQALAASVPAALLLVSLDLHGARNYGITVSLRLIFFLLTAGVAASSALAILMRDGRSEGSKVEAASRFIATRFGSPSLIFTFPVIIGLLGYDSYDIETLAVIAGLWIALTVLMPVELLLDLLDIVWSQAERNDQEDEIGTIVRVDHPNIVRIAFHDGKTWSRKLVYQAVIGDRCHYWVIPIHTQSRSVELAGTGLLCGPSNYTHSLTWARQGVVYQCNEAPSQDAALTEGGGVLTGSKLVGIVVENSTVQSIVFEVVVDCDLCVGDLVYTRQDGDFVFWQVVGAKTREEVLESNPFGVVVASAVQLGTTGEHGGFRRKLWLPEMNSAVYTTDFPVNDTDRQTPDSQSGMLLGRIPGTDLPVYADLSELISHHTAVLGMTGTGKTELALRILTNAIESKAKVLCVDLTGEYSEKLKHLSPVDMSLDENAVHELDQLIQDIETGEYSAAKEKKALITWMGSIRPQVEAQVEKFLEGETGSLGIFQLREVSATRATLRAIELYVSSIFKWAIENQGARRILIVLEEAHTIVPEIGFFSRYDRSETEAVIGKVSQVALQGRKYGVGLLVISQRTALVSKSVLSQCNSLVCFSLHDGTSLDYLSNVISRDSAQSIPGLGRFQAIAFGKGILSENPVIVEMPALSEPEFKGSTQPPPSATRSADSPPQDAEHVPAYVRDHLGWMEQYDRFCESEFQEDEEGFF